MCKEKIKNSWFLAFLANKQITSLAILIVFTYRISIYGSLVHIHRICDVQALPLAKRFCCKMGFNVDFYHAWNRTNNLHITGAATPPPKPQGLPARLTFVKVKDQNKPHTGQANETKLY